MKPTKTDNKPLWRLFDHSKNGGVSDGTFFEKLIDLGIDYLVKNGADAQAKDRWGATPFSDAQKLKVKDIELMLVNN